MPPASKTYHAIVSKTINVPAGTVLLTFQDAAMRRRWMQGPELELVKADDRSVRLRSKDGTFIAVTVQSKSANKTQVQVQHESLPSQGAAERQRAFWAQQLERLKEAVE